MKRPRSRRRGSTTTPARCAWRARGCWSRRACASRSSSASTPPSTGTCWVIPRDDATTVSPLIHPDHLERVDGFVQRAVADGQPDRRAAARRSRRPAVLQPTLFEPTLQRRRDRPARGVRAGAHLPDLRGRRRGGGARQLHPVRTLGHRLHELDGPCRPHRPRGSGRVVWVNTFLVRDLTAPFGGVGISGIGREGGNYALDFYSDLKTCRSSTGASRRGGGELTPAAPGEGQQL